jgi:probable HAF family extracellular repeat protein
MSLLGHCARRFYGSEALVRDGSTARANANRCRWIRVGAAWLIMSSPFVMSVSSSGASYVVTDLGTFGGTNTLGWGLNSSGQATGYSAGVDDEIVNSFLWNPAVANGASGSIHDLGGLGGQFSWGIGINASGQISGIAATMDDEAEHATLWNPTTPGGFSGTLHDLGTLGGTYSQGTGINDRGQLTGYSDLTGDEAWHAMLWQPTTPNSFSGAMHDIGTLGGTTSFGWDVNAGGYATGSSDTTADVDTRPFLWKPTMPNGTSGTMYDLGSLGGLEGDGSGINDHGQVAGSSTNGDDLFRAFLWTPTVAGGTSGTMVDLGTLGGTESFGYSVNAFGHVVGASYVPIDVSNYSHAFLRTAAGGMVDLNTLIDPLSDWELLDAHEVNSAGQIVGQGLINEEYRAFLLTPTLPGDFNLDGSVDARDYVMWRKYDGTPAMFSLWRSHFGQAAGSGAGEPATAGVPEPGAFALILLLGVAIAATGARSIRRKPRVGIPAMSAGLLADCFCC